MKFRTLMQFLVAGMIILTPAIAGAITIRADGSFSWTITAVQLTNPARWEYFIDPTGLIQFRGDVDYDDSRLELLNLELYNTVALLNGYTPITDGPQLGHTSGAGTGVSTIHNISGQHSAPPSTPIDIYSLTFRDLSPADPSIPRIKFYDGDGAGTNGFVRTSSSTGQEFFDFDFTGASIPEPGTITLLCLGLFGLLFRRRS